VSEQKNDHGGTSLTEGGSVSVSVHAPKLPHDAKEGDVFRFSYSQAEREKAAQGWAGSLNHCFDGQVVYRKGQYVDTYWSFGECGDGRVVRPDQGELTFVVNLADVEPIRSYEALHYDEADVFDLSYQHGCYKKLMIRKGAQPSAARMIIEVRKKEASLRAEIEFAQRNLCDLAVLRHRLESGDVSRKPWWSER
jgi:hypothetical protein